MKRAPIERFLARVEHQPNGCWRWKGPATGLTISNVRIAPRHLAWSLVGNHPIKGVRLAVTCGNEACVRLGHLVEVKGPTLRRPGRRLPDATINKIRAHRRAGWTLKELAQSFGLSVSGVSRIVNNDRRTTT